MDFTLVFNFGFSKVMQMIYLGSHLSTKYLNSTKYHEILSLEIKKIGFYFSMSTLDVELNGLTLWMIYFAHVIRAPLL